MNCVSCGKPEKIINIGGVRYSNTLQYAGACADCINKEMEIVNQEEADAKWE